MFEFRLWYITNDVISTLIWYASIIWDNGLAQSKRPMVILTNGGLLTYIETFNQVDTRRNDNVSITLKRHHDVVLT